MFKSRASKSLPPEENPLQDQAGYFPPIGTTLPNQYYQPQPGQYNQYYNPNSMTRPAPAPQPVVVPKRTSWKTFAKRFFQIVLILALLSGIFLGVKFLINASKTFNGNLFGLFQNEKLKGEDTGRVNILVAGNSSDDVGHGGADLTDSIMIISIDTENKRAFTMSVPRDLWVDIPGNGHAKINEVYQDGEDDGFSETGYAEGGMGLLQKVIGENFGLNFHYYSLVNYTAFKDAVDAVGGIDVTIESTDRRGLYDPSRDWTGPRGTPLVKLPNGVNHLTGQQALNLARARGLGAGSYGYGNSDFTRTANQRLMLIALKEKATSPGVALNPVKLASLMDSFGNNVKTDFKTSELRRLLDLSKEIPSSSIVSAGLNDVDGKNLLKSCLYSCRGSALVPAAGLDDFSDIEAYVQTLLAPPPPPATEISQ